MDCKTDVLVVGAGAGGIGAGVAAANHGARVVLLERSSDPGGTTGPGGVCHWESGIGGTGVPIDIYRILHRMDPERVHLQASGPTGEVGPVARQLDPGISKTVGIYGLGRHCCAPDPTLSDFPGGEHPIVRGRTYADTLRRYGAADAKGYPYEFYKEHCFGVCFTPEAYEQACRDLLQEHGVALWTETTVTELEQDADGIRRVRTSRGDTITVRYVVDATGTGVIAKMAGCRLSLGREGRDVFGETNAPAQSDNLLNAVTQMFRVAPRDEPAVDPLPSDIPAECWWADRFPGFSVVELPDGTWSWNQLPSMAGAEAEELGDRAAEECRRRALAGWHDVQERYPEFRRFTIHSFSPALGVRDAPRVACRYTLTQQDLEAGLDGGAARDRIAIADHTMDVHGEGHIARSRLAGPYGIPFNCLVAADCENLLIASRGAGFSAIAASSVRLTRTVMQLGQVAGTAAAMAMQRGLRVADLPVPELQTKLRADGVQLETELAGEAARRAREQGQS